MSIEIKISKKPIDYIKAINFLEKRLENLKNGKSRELIWILEHNDIYTAGLRSSQSTPPPFQSTNPSSSSSTKSTPLDH